MNQFVFDALTGNAAGNAAPPTFSGGQRSGQPGSLGSRPCDAVMTHALRADAIPSSGVPTPSASVTGPINQCSPLNRPIPPTIRTVFDSQGQSRALTTGRFQDMPREVQAQVIQLMRCANPEFYGDRSAIELGAVMASAHEVAVVTTNQPVEIPPGRTKAPFTLPPGTVLPAGTIIPSSGEPFGAGASSAEPLPVATAEPEAAILPKGTYLPAKLVLPSGTIAGAAAITYKQAACRTSSKRSATSARSSATRPSPAAAARPCAPPSNPFWTRT